MATFAPARLAGFLDNACVDVVSVDGWNQALRLMKKNVVVGSSAAVLIVSAPRD